jgi:hypothetical protein
MQEMPKKTAMFYRQEVVKSEERSIENFPTHK